MKLIKKLKNVYAIFIISYLIIFMFFLGMLFVVNRIYKEAIQSTVIDFNDYVFQKVSDSVNDVFSNINALYFSFITDKTTDEFFENIDGDFMKKQTTYNMIEDIKAYRKFSLGIDSFFIYLKQTDTVLSHQGMIDGKSFYEMYFDTSRMSYEDWKNSYIITGENKYVDMHFKEIDGVNSFNAYVFTIPSYDDLGTGVIISNKQYLVSDISDMEWGAFCDVYIFDARKELIASVIQRTDEKAKDSPSYDELIREKDSTYSTEIVVDNDKWYVITHVQQDYLDKRTEVVEKLFLLIAILGAIVLAFVLRILYMHNYQPMKKIFDLLDTSTNKESYSEIYTKVGNFVEQSRKLVSDNEKTKDKLKKVALSKFLRGEIVYNQLSYEGIEINGKHFAVLLFSINDINELFSDVKEFQSHERYFYLSFILNNIFKELFEEIKMDFYLTDVENYVVAVIGMNEPETVENIKVVLQKGIDFINENFDITLSYSISSIVEGIGNIAKAYDDTIQLQYYRQFSNIDNSLSLDDVSFSKTGKYLFNLYKEQNLIRFIKMGDYDLASSMVLHIFDEMKENDIKSLRYWRYLVADILNAVIKIKDELSDENFGSGSEMELYDELINGKDINLMKEKLLNQIKIVCGDINDGLTDKKDKTRVLFNVIKIKKYVDENFTDVNMNVNQISHYFELTPQYVAKIFKKEEGVSLLDYINRRRIEYAQELDKKGGYTIKEISKMAGFNNERTYYRVFKKYTENNE